MSCPPPCVCLSHLPPCQPSKSKESRDTRESLPSAPSPAVMGALMSLAPTPGYSTDPKGLHFQPLFPSTSQADPGEEVRRGRRTVLKVPS